jgi:hypothetical protein
MALGKITRAKSLPQTKNRGQRLTLTDETLIRRGDRMGKEDSRRHRMGQ